MPTRVIVNGAHGKMGALACATLSAHNDFELVAALSKQDHLAQAISETKADVVVELTRADCVYDNSLIIINHGARPVIGASGLLESQINELTTLCKIKQLGGIIAPNFSIGAVLMMLFAAKASEYFSEVEIIEAHHQLKLDAPSGTALKTAEMIAAARKKSKKNLPIKELLPGARGGCYHDINIHSLRLPGVLAQQKVIFGGVGETLSLTHDSIDRACFMPGVVLACQKAMQLNTLVYGLEHVL
ncbi:MAG: 4-hydroxy-tetrahydrodipicolinate reductase [Legionellales bacterium]